MERSGILSLGKLTALCTLLVVGVVLYTNGQEMFSPGALNAQRRSGVPLGGVASHAELGGNCSACHVPPWGDETMSSRCLDCHTEIRKQLDTSSPLHGRLAVGRECRACHTEHRGAHGALTSLETFDHDCTDFKLTGQHRKVDCASCHVNNVYKGTPHDCAACHAEPDIHRGKFGTNCAHCHSTSTWEGATFTHSFPLNHGRGKRHTSACVVCHTTRGDYSEYTCYGCHRHNPVKTVEKHVKKGIADVRNCATCHPTGRKHRRLAREDGLAVEVCLGCQGVGDLLPLQDNRVSPGSDARALLGLPRSRQGVDAEPPPPLLSQVQKHSPPWNVTEEAARLLRRQPVPASRFVLGELPLLLRGLR